MTEGRPGGRGGSGGRAGDRRASNGGRASNGNGGHAGGSGDRASNGNGGHAGGSGGREREDGGSGGHYDAIVVGGGHNGLVCGAYLARAGLRTLILEQRDAVGGAAVTDELLPGVRVPTLAHTVGRLLPAVMRDLKLRHHGLSLVQPAVRVFAPGRDGSAITLWSDSERSATNLRSRGGSAADEEAFLEFDRQVRALGRFLGRLGSVTPPDMRQPGLADALTGVQLGAGFKGLGTDDGRALLRLLPMAVADLLEERFSGEGLRGLLALRGVLHTAMGPRSAGTGAMLLHDSAGNGAGAAGQTVLARGGPGAVTGALASAAQGFGAEVRTGAEVVAVTTREDRVTGVALASGGEIGANVVASGVDPKRTLLGLVDPVALGPHMVWRAGNIRQPGNVAKVNLVLRGLPSFSAAGAGTADGERLLRGRIVVGAESVDGLERAHDAAKYGRLPESLVLEATIPTLVDPSLVDRERAGEAQHVMSVVVQSVPAAFREGDWDGQRETLGDRVLEMLEAVAPGVNDLVLHRQVILPSDLERDYGLTGGHPMHAEPGLDQWFAWRPLLGHARYRLPVEGLYLCGSGAHPGGGVTGGPGRNAAREILADRGRGGVR